MMFPKSSAVQALAGATRVYASDFVVAGEGNHLNDHPGGAASLLQPASFDKLETDDQWASVLYSVKDDLVVLSVDTDAISTSVPRGNKCATMLFGLEYNGSPAHLTVTGGPGDTTEWDYFHLTVDRPKNNKGSHVFYEVTGLSELTGTPSFKMSGKLVAPNSSDKCRLRNAAEHNQSSANNQELAAEVKADIQTILDAIEYKVGWSD